MSNPFDWDTTPSEIEQRQKEQIKKLEADELEIAKLFTRLFNTDEGKRVLAFLIKKTLELPVAVPGAGDANAYHREGQNSITRYIQTMIKKGEAND